MYDQHQRLEPNTGMYGPRTLFRAKRRRVQPNASELHMASTWWEPCGIDIIGVPNRSRGGGAKCNGVRKCNGIRKCNGVMVFVKYNSFIYWFTTYETGLQPVMNWSEP